MKPLRAIGLGLTLCLTAGMAGARSSGDATANFLKMGVGGRGVAMGDAHTGAVDDVMSLYWNPAGLADLYQQEVGFMHHRFAQGMDHGVLFYARPTETRGVWGLGLSHVRSGDIAGYDEGGVESNSVTASDSLLTLGWARPWDEWEWFPGLKTGANIKMLRKTLADQSATGFLADLGLQYQPQGDRWSRLRTGLMIQNIGPGLRFDAERSPAPLAVKAGAALSLFGDSMTLALDAALPRDGDPALAVGAEYRVWDLLAFRMGYKGGLDVDSGLTYGFGVGNERLKLDYAFVPFGPFGDSHRVSVGVRFGAAYRQTKVVDQVEAAYKRALARYAQGYLVEAYIQAGQILTVAPWHRPAKLLSKRIESEFHYMADDLRSAQLRAQVDEHYARGEQFFQLDDLLRARQQFEAILALQPDHMGAKTYLNRVDEKFQGITEGFYDLAVKAFGAHDFEQARDFAQRALLLSPDHAEAQVILSKANEILERAKISMEQLALKQKVAPLRDSAQELMNRKRYVEAVAKWDEILALDTTNEDARRLRDTAREGAAEDYYNQALRAAREGKYSDALKLVNLSLRYNPNEPKARELLNKISVEIPRVNEQKSRELYAQALDAFLGGDYNRALELGRQSLSHWAENPEARRLVDRLVSRMDGR